MRGIDDVLREGFERHSRALGARGGVLAERGRIVGSIRRRRRVRAGVSGAVAAVAIGGLAIGASALLPLDIHRGPAVPGPSWVGYAWCDPGTYPLPNMDAFARGYGYEGRVYADYDAMEFVYVSPDGSRETLEPDEEKNYYAVSSGGARYHVFAAGEEKEFSWDSRRFYDLVANGVDGGALFVMWSGTKGLRLLHEWTTVVPDEVPEGVSVTWLAYVHMGSLGLASTGLSPDAVPPGAVVQRVARWTDGSERVDTIAIGDTGFPGDSFEGLESVTTRVSNLPGGEVFEIVSTYDPTMTWEVACVSPDPSPVPSASPSPSMSPSPSPSPSTTATSDGVEFLSGPTFQGPETALFRCAAPLPTDAEDAIPVTVQSQVGELYVPEFGKTFDLGAGGVMTTTVYVHGTGSSEQPLVYPGWSAVWSDQDDGTHFGFVSFSALAWVDADGVVIGREVRSGEQDGLSRSTPGSTSILWTGEIDGRETVINLYSDLTSRGVPCDGVDPSALGNASIVFVHGYGTSVDDMTWSWTRLPEVPTL